MGNRNSTRSVVRRAGVALVGLVLLGAGACTTPVPANQVPLAIFTTSGNSGPSPHTVSFNAGTASDPDGSIVSYVWDFGDFTTGTGAVASHTFGAGSYTVRLTVTDNRGASSSSTTVITAAGGPTSAPTGLAKAGSGCCDTYGDFTWNQLAGATAYEISMDGFFLGGCVTDHSAVINGQVGSGRVQAVGLCLGSQYDVSIRAQANGLWGRWSPSVRITL